jgi:hypothetical protein
MKRKQSLLFQRVADPPAPANPPGPMMFFSGWLHLETGEPLCYLVEWADLPKFYAKFPELDPGYYGEPLPTEPPPGYGVAKQIPGFEAEFAAYKAKSKAVAA